MLALVLIWGGFWGALALVLGASPAMALLVATGSFVGPLAVFLLVALLDALVLHPLKMRKRRKRLAERVAAHRRRVHE